MPTTATHVDRAPDDLVASLHVLTVALHERDTYTHGHCDRVGRLASALARRLGLSHARRHALVLAARFHDIGKIGIPDDVLLHPHRLDPDRLAIMRTHSARGARVFIATGRDDAHEVARIIRHHHEAVDGSGYPDGLIGEAIPLEARMLAVVDSYDAMTSDRPYRRALGVDQTLARLRADAARRLDPDLVDAFIGVLHTSPG
ncbi:HD family phosphohydrolase [Xanthomonas citri pv. mangiferaeindicae]|nr:HD family phosphohydrolase [Xanthomonas citri pv. mangiferaeindicae]